MENISETEIKHFVSLNPEFYFTYYTIADYYYKRKNFDKASDYYSTALEKEVTFITDRDRILRKLEKIKKA